MTAAPLLGTPVPRTQERMSHDVWLPAETVALRGEARVAVEKHLAPAAREIGAAEESGFGAFLTIASG